jgi:protein-S-isoprenylcysteine O-methyltransferase Ste14
MTGRSLDWGRLWVKFLVFFAVTALLPGALLFGAAGTLDWPMGWLLLVSASVMNVGSRIVLIVVAPDVARERWRFGAGLEENVKAWDRALAPVVGLLLPFAIIALSALDWRFGWSPPVPPAARWAAYGLFVAGMLFGSWALLSNRFFLMYVRIQAERGHTVVSAGPYALVRHPAYAGAVLRYLAIPVLLDGLWGLAPAALYALGLGVRTALEDRMLRRELDGYAAYAQRVRYRLLPGVW